MSHVLDNTVWHALTGLHQHFAIGDGLARQYPRDMAPFAGLAEATAQAYADLARDLPSGTEARLFRPSHEPLPQGWVELDAFPMLQMVASRTSACERVVGQPFLLARPDTPAMLELATIAKPGPFGRRTPELGRYLGVRINAMVAPWFDEERPKALSHAFNGASLGGVTFTPLLVWLTATIGFQSTAILLGLTMIVVVVPLAHRYLRPVPSPAQSQSTGDSRRSWRAALMRTRRFATVSAAFALALFAQVGLLSHLLTRLAPVLGAEGASLAVSLTTLSAVVGRLLLGWLIGDHDRRYAACLNFVVQSIGVTLSCLADTPSALLLGCTLVGLGVGNVAALPALIAQAEFRPADVGTVVALVIAIDQAAFALAPAILGAIRDVTVSYQLSFAIAGVAQIVAAVVILLGRKGVPPGAALAARRA